MKRMTKIELGIACVCVVALGTSAIAAHFSENKLDISVADSGTSSVVITDPKHIGYTGSKSDELESYSSINDINITVSFTAKPDQTLSSEDMLVFIKGDPPITVNVPIDTDYSYTEEIAVTGTITKIEGYTLTLENCEITTKPTDQTITAITSAPLNETNPQTTVQTTPAVEETSGLNSVTVYVSSSGKYHSKPECSGMKNYTEMPQSLAISSGHEPCKKCN